MTTSTLHAGSIDKPHLLYAELSTDAAVKVGLKATAAGELLTTTGAGPSGGLSEADFDTKTGALTETAPATDIASSGLNGRLQRIAQRLTSLIALLPAALVGGRLSVSGAHLQTAATLTSAAAAVGTVDVSVLGAPYTHLKFTKSDVAETVTIVVGASHGKGVMKITGLTAETILVTGLINGVVETSALPVRTLVTLAVASGAALTNGSFWIVTGNEGP